MPGKSVAIDRIGVVSGADSLNIISGDVEEAHVTRAQDRNISRRIDGPGVNRVRAVKEVSAGQIETPGCRARRGCPVAAVELNFDTLDGNVVRRCAGNRDWPGQ